MEQIICIRNRYVTINYIWGGDFQLCLKKLFKCRSRDLHISIVFLQRDKVTTVFDQQVSSHVSLN